MNLKDNIIEILKRGEKFRARKIADRVFMLNGGIPITVEEVKTCIFNDLRGVVKYDNINYEYYILNKKITKIPITTNDFILETLKTHVEPMSSMDISNYVRLKYNKSIKSDDIVFAILTELKHEVGISDSKNIKYFLF